MFFRGFTMAQLALLHVSIPTTRTALRIARALITQRLAVSVHVSASQALTGNLRGDAVKKAEQVVMIKTLPSHVTRLAEWLEREHPADQPGISRLTAEVNDAYYSWAEEQLLR